MLPGAIWCHLGAAWRHLDAPRSSPGAPGERPGAPRQRHNEPTRHGQLDTHQKSLRNTETRIFFTCSPVKNKIISENYKLDNSFCKKWRTPVLLWPDSARRAPPGQPRARLGAPRECFGSVRNRHGSVQTSLIVEENWTHAKILVCLSNLS